MSETGISRRKFVAGAAITAAAATMPILTNAAPAAGTPTLSLPIATPDWTPLNPKECARLGWEIYKGLYPPQAA